MATSGTLLGDVVSESERSYLDWQLTSQSTATNSSTIAWQAGWKFSGNSCRGLRAGVAVINGTTVYSSSGSGDNVHAYNASHDHNGGTGRLQTASGVRTITHGSDGTKSFAASITMTGFSAQVSNNSTTFALPTINRLPGKPGTPMFWDVAQTFIAVNWTPNPADILPNTDWDVSYGTTTDANDAVVTTTGALLKYVTGLQPYTRYYFKVRATNSAGTGPYSDVSPGFYTVGGAYVNVGGVWTPAVPYVRVAGVWTLARPWVRTLGEWLETYN